MRHWPPAVRGHDPAVTTAERPIPACPAHWDRDWFSDPFSAPHRENWARVVIIITTPRVLWNKNGLNKVIHVHVYIIIYNTYYTIQLALDVVEYSVLVVDLIEVPFWEDSIDYDFACQSHLI